jgi:opacity protein-like surface antigen
MLAYWFLHHACKKLLALTGARPGSIQRASPMLLLVFGFFMLAQSAHAAVLPEDRADLLYHSYDGGGAEISGPSLLVRKKFSENVSATFNNYTDNISSASIDVITTASPYTENREENSISVDYLRDKTQMSIGFTESDESDYDASTVSINIAQDMFGDLTTVNMGYAQGANDVGRNGDAGFSEEADWRSYRLSLTQVISKKLIMSFALEAITDEGYLNNPYRTVRFLDPTVARGYSYQGEVYPNTRTSSAFAIRGNYYLEHRAALHAGYRYFSDTWGIEANTLELGYTWPYNDDWLFEFTYRFYDQGSADFYSDLFPYQDAQNFLARDKELSTFTSHTLGVGAGYEFVKAGSGLIKRARVNLNLDLINFEYQDFRDLTVVSDPGQEPLYDLDATVIRAFISAWF